MTDKRPNAARVKTLMPLINRVQRAYWAKNEAIGLYEEAERALRTAVGPDHEHTNVACRVNKIGGHIYDNTYYPSGGGRRNCILCGLDDFDF